MTVEDGKKINESFEKKQKEIDSLKSKLDSAIFKIDTIKEQHRIYMMQSGFRIQNLYNDYITEYNKNKSILQERDSIKAMYMANKKIYETNEKRFTAELRSAGIFGLVLTLAVMGMAAL